MEHRMPPDTKPRRNNLVSRSPRHVPRVWPAKAFFWTSLTLSLAIAGAAIWVEGGWLDLRQPLRKMAQLEAESEALERENQHIRAKIAAIEDLSQVEKTAREELGLVKPGELVYELSKGKRPQPPHARGRTDNAPNLD